MKQQLSTLVDGEMDFERCEHILLAAKSDGEVAQAWREYHIIRDVMRNDLWQQSDDLTARIMSHINDEPTILHPVVLKGNTKASSLFPRLGKYSWSIAASLAAVFFVGLFVVNQYAELQPVQMVDNDADQYVIAHHNYAPNSETYYIHNASYTAGE